RIRSIQPPGGGPPKRKRGRPRGRPLWSCCLRDPHAVGARALRALLDVERDALAAGQRIEVQRRIHAGPVEEVLLPVLGSDDAEPAVRHDLLDRPLGHQKTPLLELLPERTGLFEKKSSKTTANTPSCGRSWHITKPRAIAPGDRPGRRGAGCPRRRCR